jgi:hypothetical protein
MTGFVRLASKTALIAVFVLVVFPSAAWAETLNEVIAKSSAPPDARPLANLNREIADYSVLDTQGTLAIAYYVPGDGPVHEGPLFVDRYDRKTRQWRSASFSRDQLATAGSDCVGSITSLSANAAGYLATTHITPSAECTLVLSPDLQLRATLYGWPLATLADGSIVYHRSQIHFAAVHAAEVAIYSRKTGRSYTIYPAKPYQAVRQTEIARLEEFFNTHLDWCNHHNHPCDPELFDNSISSPVVVEDKTDAIAFIVDYGSDAEDATAPPVAGGRRKVVYIYRYVSNEFGFRYREMLLSELTARFGDVPLSRLLTPVHLQAIFAK